MEKQRLIIMNGHCIRQVFSPDKNKWLDMKIEKARGRPPGLYKLHEALPADLASVQGGVISYIDDSRVYQRLNTNMFWHARERFDKVPDLGAFVSISYTDGMAVVLPWPKQEIF
jgi:hypothetical protein